jgi:HAD superfamily hydrolase (TIGR01549 family)
MTPLTAYPDWIQQLEYIVWDLDGTLYQISEEVSRKIQQKVWELIAEKRGISLKQAKELHQQLYAKLQSNTRTLIAAGVERELVLRGDWHSQIQLEAIKPNSQLVKQVQALTRFKHIINTNSSQKSAEKKLKKIGFDLNFFKVVIGNPDMIGALKPDLAPYKYVLNLTQAAAENHLFVGDRYETDLAPAKKVGMHTALVYANDKRADLNFNSTPALLDFLSARQ